jgi:hypothetical protein
VARATESKGARPRGGSVMELGWSLRGIFMAIS